MSSESGYLPVENGRLYYEVEGDGPALTLIHAGIANVRMWDENVPAFAERYRVIRYDTRGFGRTTTEGATFSNRQDIADLFDHLGVERAHLLGCSRGGTIAVDFTLERPDRVVSLMPVAASFGGFEHEDPAVQPLNERMEQLSEEKRWDELVEMEVAYWVDGPLQQAGRAAESARDRVRQWQLENYRTQTVEGQPRVLEPPAAGRLAEIHAPTLVIWGDLDESGVIEASRRMVAEIRGARGVEMPGVAHMLSLERPAEFNRIVLDFLADVDRSR